MEYKHYTPIEHVLKIPDMYIGSDEQAVRDEFLYNFEEKRITKVDISLPEGVERLFLEVLSNASDNVGRSRRLGIDPGVIDVTMTETTITVRNEGMPIPIEMHEEGVYVPELIFGTMLTSSNYEGDRHEAGRNGLGAKLCNIYSVFFSVDIGDGVNGIRYTQTWEKNMSVRGEPQFEEYQGPDYVLVTFTMDFERFGYQQYPDEAFNLYARHCADISFTSKVKTTFNEIVFDVSNIKNYATLYFGNAVDRSLVHYQYAPGIKAPKKKGTILAADGFSLPNVELIVIDTPDAGECVSFVNFLMTKNGGVHVQAAIKAVSTLVVNIVNTEKPTKSAKAEKRGPKITIADVKPHISIILSVRVVNPKFAGQMKSSLNAPTPKITLTEEELKPMMKWDLLIRLYASLEAKQYNQLLKTDGKKKRNIGSLKGEDANEAGGNDSMMCGLFVVEGRSAMGYAVKMISNIDNGRDHVGVIPMKGKPLNVMNADNKQIAGNLEWQELKKMLGLREGMDYTDDENFSTLRYGYLVILADADDDGKHITGLIMLYFFCRFPSLLQRKFVHFMRTPIIRVTKGKQCHKFYTQTEYLTWKEESTGNWKTKYYKGLGSSKDADIKDDFQDPKYVTCIYDDRTSDAMRLAFDKDLADKRKEWIAHWKPFDIQYIEEQSIHDYINQEFIEFSVVNLQRSIPSIMDGLKVSQRKIIWAAFKYWGWVRGKAYEEFKIAQFGSYVATETNYHHGEKCLEDTIVGMAQDFVGSNNLPYFVRNGQVGTRNMGGKDKSESRYTFTHPEVWLAYVFRKEDIPLLQILEDDGKPVEPEFLLPTIPLHLINGSNGIGTGHSTFIPCYDPEVTVEWLIKRLEGYEEEELLPIYPWYQGFKGETFVIERANKPKRPVGKPEILDEIKDNEVPVEVDLNKRALVTKGIMKYEKKDIIIEELPIGRWMHYYSKWLDKLVEDKVITSYRNNSKDNSAYFRIKTKESLNEDDLRLVKVFGLSNMVLLNTSRTPVKYQDAEEILETFFLERLPYYQLRKENMLNELEQEMKQLSDKMKFIRLVIDQVIEIRGIPKNTILGQMKEHEIPGDLLKTTKAYDFTKEEVESLQKRLDSKIKERDYINSLSREDLWIKDLNEFLTIYKKYHKK